VLRVVALSLTGLILILIRGPTIRVPHHLRPRHP
jgi:hypothetical protein